MFSRQRDILHESSKSFSPTNPDRKKYLYFLLSVMAVYFSFFGYVNFWVLWGFGYSLPDMGVHQQVLWMAGNLQWPVYSATYPYDLSQSWIGMRFAPLYPIIVGPIFRLANFHTEALLIIHLMGIAITAILIFYICLRLGVKERMALLWSLIYLFNPVTINMVLHSIQEHSLIVPVTATGLWALVSNKFRLFLVSVIALALLKDHMGLSAAGFGLLWGWYHKNWKIGGAVAISGIIYLLLVLLVFKPAFSEYAFVFFTDLEDVGTDVAKQSFARYSWIKLPWPEPVFVFFRLLVYKISLVYYAKILGPLLFMPLISFMFFLPSSADLIANILSEHPSFKWTYYYYSSAIILTFVISSCATMIFLCSISPKIKKAQEFLVVIILILNIGGTISYSHLSRAFEWIESVTAGNVQTEHSDEFKRILAKLPESVALTAPKRIAVSFSKRREIYPLEIDYIRSDTIVFIAGRKYFRTTYKKLGEILSDNSWGITYWDNPWVIMERGKEDSIDDDSLRQKLVDFYK